MCLMQKEEDLRATQGEVANEIHRDKSKRGYCRHDGDLPTRLLRPLRRGAADVMVVPALAPRQPGIRGFLHCRERARSGDFGLEIVEGCELRHTRGYATN